MIRGGLTHHMLCRLDGFGFSYYTGQVGGRLSPHTLLRQQLHGVDLPALGRLDHHII